MKEILTFVIIGDVNSKIDGKIYEVYRDEETILHHEALNKTANYFKAYYNYQINEDDNYTNNLETSRNITDNGHIVYMNLSGYEGIIYIPLEPTINQLKTLKENISLIPNEKIYIVNEEYNEFDEEFVNKEELKKMVR